MENNPPPKKKKAQKKNEAMSLWLEKKMRLRMRPLINL